MPKAIQGIAELGGAALIGAGMLFPGTAAFFNNPIFYKALEGLTLAGASMVAGAIASELTSNRGTNLSTRQPASQRQIVYGTQRVGGTIVYLSTTGSHHDQYNMCIVIAGHVCDSVVALYLDGRQVHFVQGGVGNKTRNGVNFGGSADDNTYTGPNGVQYNFGGKVYCEMRYGDQLPGDVISGFTANDPVWAASANGSPWVGGCTYCYLKLEYDTNVFPSFPEIKFTLNGKQVFDPRTNTTAFSTNWALICADILTDPIDGFGDSRVNQAQLIAAANVCDEQVELAGGGTEARYTTSYHYDTSAAPGDILTTMLQGAEGRICDIGGEYYLFPGYWQGPSFSFDENALAGTITFEERGRADLFNRVNGTYTAPNFPYNVAGNYYDGNGFADGQIQNNFGYAFQSTSYPQYACDTLHGYASDQFLAEDGGQLLETELPLPTVLSIAQCQRVAKIHLLRNRQKGYGTFPMNLAAYQMQPTDVMNFSFPYLGWNNKVLEIVGVSLKLVEQGGIQSLQTEVEVQETDISVYEWSTAEELTIYDVPASPSQTPYDPAPPTEITLVSGAGTAIVGADGIVRPRIEVEWNSPLDILTKQIQVQHRIASTGLWQSNSLVDVANQFTYIDGVVAGQAYDVRIRSLRANGAVSVWLEENNFTVSATATRVGSVYLSPNSPYNIGNNITLDSIVEGGAATIRGFGPGGDGSSYLELVGQTNFTLPAFHLTGLTFATTYYIVYDVTFYDPVNLIIGGYVLYFTDFNDTLNDSYLFVGVTTTCTSTYLGTGGTGTGSGSSGGGGSAPGGGRNPVSIDQEASTE